MGDFVAPVAVGVLAEAGGGGFGGWLMLHAGSVRPFGGAAGSRCHEGFVGVEGAEDVFGEALEGGAVEVEHGEHGAEAVALADEGGEGLAAAGAAHAGGVVDGDHFLGGRGWGLGVQGVGCGGGVVPGAGAVAVVGEDVAGIEEGPLGPEERVGGVGAPGEEPLGGGGRASGEVVGEGDFAVGGGFDRLPRRGGGVRSSGGEGAAGRQGMRRRRAPGEGRGEAPAVGALRWGGVRRVAQGAFDAQFHAVAFADGPARLARAVHARDVGMGLGGPRGGRCIRGGRGGVCAAGGGLGAGRARGGLPAGMGRPWGGSGRRSIRRGLLLGRGGRAGW